MQPSGWPSRALDGARAADRPGPARAADDHAPGRDPAASVPHRGVRSGVLRSEPVWTVQCAGRQLRRPLRRSNGGGGLRRDLPARAGTYPVADRSAGKQGLRRVVDHARPGFGPAGRRRSRSPRRHRRCRARRTAHAVPQAWSSALRAHPFGLAGIAYSARHDDDALCYALFEATAGTIEEVQRERDLDQDWFWTIAERYHVGLAPH